MDSDITQPPGESSDASRDRVLLFRDETRQYELLLEPESRLVIEGAAGGVRRLVMEMRPDYEQLDRLLSEGAPYARTLYHEMIARFESAGAEKPRRKPATQRRRITASETGADLRGRTYADTDISESAFRNCIGEGVSFDRSKLSDVRIEAVMGEKVSFRGASFDEAVLRDCYLGPRTLDLSGTRFRGAKLKDVTFMLPRLTGADFTGATLTNVYFRTGLLENVSFRDARLKRVAFEGAVLEGADFTGATFESMDFWGEPNWEGAIISDELRYRFCEVAEPARKFAALLADPSVSEGMTTAIERLKASRGDFIFAPACAFGIEEVGDLPGHFFIETMKALKRMP